MHPLRLIKDIFAFRKTIQAGIAEQKQKQSAYLAMPPDTLSCLSDEELLQAALIRTQHIVDSFDDMEKGFLSLNNEQRIVYALNDMEMEVNNGGLCQFLANSSHMVAPFVSEYMAMIGAVEHKALFDQFISRNNINLQDLTSFRIEKITDYPTQYERYPFEEYDTAFYGLTPLEANLIPFVRNHFHKF